MQNQEESPSSTLAQDGSPWQRACLLPSEHGLAVDVQAHMCVPGAYVLSTPAFFLLARPVQLDADWMRVHDEDPEERDWNEDYWYCLVRDELIDPFHRFPPESCNAWCIGVLAGDMVAAYRALVAAGGEHEFICWQDRRNGYRCRRTGPAFNKFLSTIHERKRRQQEGHEGTAGGGKHIKSDQRQACGCP